MATATPPARGMGRACTLRSEGLSSTRQRTAARATYGVSRYAIASDNTKTAIILLMSYSTAAAAKPAVVFRGPAVRPAAAFPVNPCNTATMRSPACPSHNSGTCAVRNVLRRLSPELREAVILRDLQDMDYREIAAVLRVPEGTVKSRINRGRAELARVLQRTYRQVM